MTAIETGAIGVQPKKGRGSLVAFYAAQAFETAPELPRPAGAARTLAATLVAALVAGCAAAPKHDPTLGRMLLQSQHEHATRELLIIAAGLSIQDPRERPMDKKEAAAAAHKRFADPQSDFLTLLKIWDAVHDEWERIRSQGQRRKFCRANFLNYQRMREWQDLHAQLHGALEDLGRFKLNESSADYAAIHRSILTGLLAHVATRKERNIYKGVGNRELVMFPGSALFDRNEKPQKGGPSSQQPAAPGKPAPKSIQQPPWIVAGEIVEMSASVPIVNVRLQVKLLVKSKPCEKRLVPWICNASYQFLPVGTHFMLVMLLNCGKGRFKS